MICRRCRARSRRRSSGDERADGEPHRSPLPSAVSVSYNVSGIGTSGAKMPVTAATCLFTADVSDPAASDGTVAVHHTSSMTDPTTGAVTVELIPTETGSRTYVVTVTPDATQPFATKTTTVNVGAGATGYGPDINLSLRAQLWARCSAPTASRCTISWSCRRRRRWPRRWRRRPSRSRGRRSRRPRAPTGASLCASTRACGTSGWCRRPTRCCRACG